MIMTIIYWSVNTECLLLIVCTSRSLFVFIQIITLLGSEIMNIFFFYTYRYSCLNNISKLKKKKQTHESFNLIKICYSKARYPTSHMGSFQNDLSIRQWNHNCQILTGSLEHTVYISCFRNKPKHSRCLV